MPKEILLQLVYVSTTNLNCSTRKKHFRQSRTASFTSMALWGKLLCWEKWHTLADMIHAVVCCNHLVFHRKKTWFAVVPNKGKLCFAIVNSPNAWQTWSISSVWFVLINSASVCVIAVGLSLTQLSIQRFCLFTYLLYSCDTQELTNILFQEC